MILPRGIGIDVLSSRPAVSHRTTIALLSQWMMAEFEPRKCREILEAMLADGAKWGIDEGLLRPGAIEEGGLVATDALLYPKLAPLVRIGRLEEVPTGLQVNYAWLEDVDFAAEESETIAEALRLLTRTDDLAAFRAMGPVLGFELARELKRPAAPTPSPQWPVVDRPGIYRREHGSAIIRSRTTSILLDPLGFWARYAHAPIDVDGAPIDAICITHGHLDHWNVASILRYAAPTTPVIVPRVPRVSIMAWSDMAATLQMFGQKALAPEWGTEITIGDIRIEVLPFYGEQATRHGPGPASADIRNWGNCYRFDTPDFSVVSLIDSGADPEGDMADVLRASAAKSGPIDFVMSSLPIFKSPFFFGLPENYLTLPFEHLRELHAVYAQGKLASVTPGPDGVASTCSACDARYYLPYGNGYEGVGVPIGDVGICIGDPPESAAVARINDLLAASGARTRAIEWNPGDVVSLEAGELVRRPYADLVR